MHGGGVHVYEKFAICFDRQVAHYVRWLRIIQQRLFFCANVLAPVLIGKVKVLTERLTPYRSEAS